MAPWSQWRSGAEKSRSATGSGYGVTVSVAYFVTPARVAEMRT